MNISVCLGPLGRIPPPEPPPPPPNGGSHGGIGIMGTIGLGTGRSVISGLGGRSVISGLTISVTLGTLIDVALEIANESALLIAFDVAVDVAIEVASANGITIPTGFVDADIFDSASEPAIDFAMESERDVDSDNGDTIAIPIVFDRTLDVATDAAIELASLVGIEIPVGVVPACVVCLLSEPTPAINNVDDFTSDIAIGIAYASDCSNDFASYRVLSYALDFALDLEAASDSVAELARPSNL